MYHIVIRDSAKSVSITPKLFLKRNGTTITSIIHHVIGSAWPRIVDRTDRGLKSIPQQVSVKMPTVATTSWYDKNEEGRGQQLVRSNLSMTGFVSEVSQEDQGGSKAGLSITVVSMDCILR